MITSNETQQMNEYYNEQDEVVREQMLNDINNIDNDEFFKHRKHHLLIIGISAFVGGLIAMRYRNRLENMPIFRAII